MKWFIVTTFLTISTIFGNPISNTLIPIPTKKLTPIEQILKTHEEFAQELYRDSIITVKPKLFAKMLLVMTYCESGIDTSALSNDGEYSHGIYQFTQSTRKYLGIPKDIRQTTIKQQNSYYKKFMQMVGKSKTQRIKSVLDLHSMNYTPARMFKNILSTKGHILTRSDLIEFQQKRVSENHEIQKIYNSLWTT